jgi:Family of unknown function (DUF6582)
MAKVLAYISGTALVPGVSRNGRLYTSEAIGNAVRRAQKRIADGKRPIGMYTHHETTNTRELVGAVTKIWQEDDGSAKYVSAIGDTRTGRDIANLADPEGDAPAFLRGVSIRGNWVGSPRRERNPEGGYLETGSDLEIGRLDWTSEPGVIGAGVDSFRYATAGSEESGERFTISESAPEALVETAITEETMPANPVAETMPAAVREAARSLLPLDVPHLLANGLCATCPGIGEAATVPMSKRGAGLQGKSDTAYADPGYQADKKQRYELDTPAHIRAAWAFISKTANAKAYSAAQLKRIKGRIKAAAGKAGITIAAEGWTVGPAIEVTEALVEYYGGDPESCGSYSLSATNGPTTVTVCSYGLDPADLQVILAQACKGAGMALSAIDPDMDGDVDLPGEDPDESAPGPEAPAAETDEASPAVTEAAPVDPAPEPAAAHPEGTEAPAMGETTTTTEAAGTATAAAAAPLAIPQEIMDEALRKAAKKAAKRALAATGAAPAESAPAAPAAAAVTESDDDRIARIVEERIAAARAAAPAAPAVTETEEQRIERIVEARLVRERQEITASGGGPARKGLVAEHAGSGASSGEIPADFPMKNGVMIPTEEWTEANRRAVGAQLEGYVLGSRASQ